MRAVLLAAGLGTRLRPLTERWPKPVVPLLHRPLGGYALERLASAGIREVVANTHYRAELVERELARFAGERGIALSFSRETQLLGTGGGTRKALGKRVDEPVVVINSDVLFAVDLEAALAEHRATNAFATMVVRPDPELRHGAVEVDDEGSVRRILGQPSLGDAALTRWMFTGVHILSPAAVAALPEEGCIIRQGYLDWLAAGRIIRSVVDEAPFRDLGTPAELLGAQHDLLRGVVVWPGLDARAAALHPTAAIAEGAQLIDTVVGEGATVGPGASLDRCLVLPGSRATGRLSQTIIGPDFVLGLP